MGFFDLFRRRPIEQAPVKYVVAPTRNAEVIVGAKDERERTDYQTYYNGNITFSSGLTGYEYDNILRNKQNNIVTLYQ